MAVKPENTFRSGVHKHLPPRFKHEKMSNQYTSGTPDDYYSGSKGDLWVEYKFLPKTPQRAIVKPMELLSPLQAKWINEHHEDFKHSLERTVAVVIGCPDGGIILRDQEWELEFSAQQFRDRLVPRKAIAQWITQTTTR
jgi:hypothetical protein